MTRPVPECGTISAYARHMRRKETADRDCARAHADYMRDYRASIRNGHVRMVLAVGVKRRVQALMAMGFTVDFLAHELDVPTNLIGHWHRKAKTVYVATHEKVARLFDRLEATMGPSELGAMRARRKGWPTTIAWDEDWIDDPDAHPNLTGYEEKTVRALLAGERPQFEDADLVEAVRRTVHLGTNAQARLFGVGWRAVDRRLPRAQGVA